MTHPQIVELADAATKRNAAQGITGARMTSGGLFFQIIEGPAEAIDGLYSSLLLDERHLDVLPLAIEDSAQARLYPDWGMKPIDLDEGSASRLEPLRVMLNAILTQRVLVQELTGALERAVTRELSPRRRPALGRAMLASAMGRSASVVLLAVAAACTQSPAPDGCRDDDCGTLCRAAGRRAGACNASGLCVCDGFADAELPDVLDDRPPEDVEPEAAEDVAAPDDFTGDPAAPDVPADVVDSDEGDGAPTDVDWTPGGSHAACTNLMPGTCPAGEICEDDFCPPWGDGACVTRPASCPPWDHPVCGCNGLTYANECLRLMAGDGPKHDGRCVPGEDEPYCDSMGGWEHYWADRPLGMERSWCTGVACSGCTAECRGDGLPGEGWYAVCPEPPAWGSGGCEDDGLIHLADCL